MSAGDEAPDSEIAFFTMILISSSDNYNSQEDMVPENQDLLMQLKQMTQILEAMLKKESDIYLDGSKVNASIKKQNNKA